LHDFFKILNTVYLTNEAYNYAAVFDIIVEVSHVTFLGLWPRLSSKPTFL